MTGNSYAFMLANLMRGPSNYHFAMTGCLGATIINAIANDAAKDKARQTTVYTPT